MKKLANKGFISTLWLPFLLAIILIPILTVMGIKYFSKKSRRGW